MTTKTKGPGDKQRFVWKADDVEWKTPQTSAQKLADRLSRSTVRKTKPNGRTA